MSDPTDSGRSTRVRTSNLKDGFRPEAYVIGRVLRDPAPSTMVMHITEGDSHDLLCRTRRITALCTYSQRLMTAPGVGPITALTFKAGVDDPTRFRRSRTVAAHFGLTPRRFQSGEIDFDGHISRAGDANVRATLYVAANGRHSRPGE